jgi:hypothetical protein
MRRRNALPALATSLRDGYASKVGFAATTLIVGLKLFQMWNENRLKTQPNSVLSPDKIDAHKEGWAGALLRSIGFKATTTPTMKHATSPQLIDAFKKNNLFWADITRPNGESCGCNIFFPRKNVAWLPYHVFFPRSEMHSGGQDPTKYFPFDDLTVKVNRGGNKPGSIFTFKCSLSMSVVSNEHDLVCIYVPNCPDLKTRLNMLPLTRPEGSGLAKMMYRNAQSFLEEKVTIHYGSYSHEYLPFYGGKYTTSLAKPGFCMGLAIADTKDPFIAGFHIAGRARAKEGYCQTVTLSEAEQLIKKLSEVRGVVLSTESGTLPAEQYGRKVLTSEAIHCHSMPAKLPATAYVDVLGSTKLRTQQKSVVKPSPISESVKQHFGVENTWGPPQLRPNWKAYNNTLEYVVDPADMFPPADVEFARRDWIEPLLDKMTDYVQTEDFRPLTDKESILGIPGRRFLEPIPMSTSMGFPVFGKKEKFFTEVRDGEELIDRIPDKAIVDEIKRIHDCYHANQRAYVVTSATLKDEPTPVDSPKVRVFQCGPIAFGMMIRKYFLPIVRFLHLHPILAESAVGLNSFSPQWQELTEHITKFASDSKVIAWDYSKYDVRMSSQITRAVLVSYIELAERGGYPQDALEIMRKMVNDLTHPVIDWNGTLLIAYNLNTSGNNITVDINSTAGSIYVRLGFFALYKHLNVKFRDKVAITTYGDDIKGSVDPSFRKFNFISFKRFLACYNMKITLPDKGDGEREFLNDNEADFLKRTSCFIPEIGYSLGRLDEKSIFKSLHANLASSSSTPMEVACSCIDSAMHEWFAHGRDVFEDRRQKMLKLCEQHELTLSSVQYTFDERVSHWLCKYSSSGI